MNKRVSIITTVLNEAKSIEHLLQVLLSQSHKPEEIIVVDGGSTDSTMEIIKKYSKIDSSIRLIVEEGANIAQGRNVAIQNAKHSLIAVIDAGCRPDRRWLEELIRPFSDNNSLDVVAGLVKVEAHNLFEFFSGLLTLPGGLKEIDEKNFPIYGRSAAFKKEVWEKAGGYPEWLYTAEDSLFEEKLRKMGANIRLAKESIVHWRPRKTFWKMGKMFYLYGRGAGRIGKSPKGAYYHFRNYLVGTVLLIISFFYPVALLIFAAGVGYIYKGFYRPIISRVKKVCPGWKTEFYVPLIVFIRTLSYSIGLLMGNYEYKHVSGFKENLEGYLREDSSQETVVRRQ